MSNEFGWISQFFSQNPPAAIGTGAVGTALLVAWLLRLFRNEVRSAAIDKAAQGILESVQDDNKTLRLLLKEAEIAREKARKDLLECQLTFGAKINELNSSLARMHEERVTLNDTIEKLKEKSELERAMISELQMQLSGQLSTIEQLAVKVRKLEDEQSQARARRRSTDRPGEDDDSQT